VGKMWPAWRFGQKSFRERGVGIHIRARWSCVARIWIWEKSEKSTLSEGSIQMATVRSRTLEYLTVADATVDKCSIPPSPIALSCEDVFRVRGDGIGRCRWF
jgi:hypothetical protein